MKYCKDCKFKNECPDEEITAEDCAFLEFTVGNLFMLDSEKLDYRIKMHDNRHIPAIKFYDNCGLGDTYSLQSLGLIYSKRYCDYDGSFLFDGKKDFTLRQFLSAIDRHKIGRCSVMFDYFADGLGTEGTIDSFKIDEKNKTIILTRNE